MLCLQRSEWSEHFCIVHSVSGPSCPAIGTGQFPLATMLHPRMHLAVTTFPRTTLLQLGIVALRSEGAPDGRQVTRSLPDTEGFRPAPGAGAAGRHRLAAAGGGGHDTPHVALWQPDHVRPPMTPASQRHFPQVCRLTRAAAGACSWPGSPTAAERAVFM